MKQLATVADVISAFGGPSAMAKRFGLAGPSAVSNWKAWGRFPDYLHMKIYVAAEREGLNVAPELLGRANGGAHQ